MISIKKEENKKLIVLYGETGCGKTYHAINELCNDRIVYVAPCRQLVNEVYIKYASEYDSLSTGDCHIDGTDDGNLFAVYESVREEMLKNYKSLIIDEAQFLVDGERSPHLINIKNEAERLGLNVILVSATINFNIPENYEYIKLESKFKVPEKVELNSYEEFEEKLKQGLQTIFFVGGIRRAEELSEQLKEDGYKVGTITGQCDPSERLITQLDFYNKEIQIVVCTNVLAQGINFPCSLVFIDYDMFSTNILFSQKLGRLGRPLLSDDDYVYYYNSSEEDWELDQDKWYKSNISIKKHETDRDHEIDAFNKCIDEFFGGYTADYHEYRYCTNQLRAMDPKKIYRERIDEFIDNNDEYDEYHPDATYHVDLDEFTEAYNKTIKNIDRTRKSIKELLINSRGAMK